MGRLGRLATRPIAILNLLEIEISFVQVLGNLDLVLFEYSTVNVDSCSNV